MAEQQDFYGRAKLFGHSIEALDAGMTISTTRSIANVDELKTVFQQLGGADDPEIGKLLFDGIPIGGETDAYSADALLRRVSQFVYGLVPLSDEDRALTASVFPIEIALTSAKDYTPTAPVLIHDPVKAQGLNYLTLTLNEGIYFTIYETIVIMTMDKLVRNGSNGNKYLGDFNIFGATGAVGSQGGTGSVGGTGTHGNNGNCSSPGVQGKSGGPGGGGKTGGTGSQGGNGDPGLASQQATITITTEVQGNVYFFTRSGTGGAGGTGGRGGSGGTGGNGGNGASCGCEHTDGGNAGNGGTGGIGGLGGNGNNAVNAAANVVVSFPSAYAAQMFRNSAQAPYGNYGAGGAKGPGGKKGNPGDRGGAGKCPKGNNGSAGSDGGAGSDGNHGNQGTVEGNPAVISWKMF